jgi:hypothetical protein
VQVEQRADQDGDETGHGATSAGELFDSEELRQLSGYARLAELLKEAHGVLRGMDLELPDRADFVRRLLVITAASRHDQDDAMRRLERFLSAVDEKRGAAPEV